MEESKGGDADPDDTSNFDEMFNQDAPTTKSLKAPAVHQRYVRYEITEDNVFVFHGSRDSFTYEIEIANTSTSAPDQTQGSAEGKETEKEEESDEESKSGKAQKDKANTIKFYNLAPRLIIKSPATEDTKAREYREELTYNRHMNVWEVSKEFLEPPVKSGIFRVCLNAQISTKLNPEHICIYCFLDEATTTKKKEEPTSSHRDELVVYRNDSEEEDEA
jgi:hypothetical protein